MSAIFSDPPQPPTPSRMPSIPSISPVRSSGLLRKRQSSTTSPTRSNSPLFTSSLGSLAREQQQSTKKRRILGEIEINTLPSPLSSSLNGAKSKPELSPIKMILKAEEGAETESTSAELSPSEREASSLRQISTNVHAVVDDVDDRSSATPPLSPREHLHKQPRAEPRRHTAPPAVGKDIANHLRTMRLRLAFAHFKVEHGLISSTADQVLTEMQSSDTENEAEEPTAADDAVETSNEDEESWWESYHRAHHLSESQGHQPLCTCT